MTDINEWKCRWDMDWSFPYQNHSPFHDNDIVEVANQYHDYTAIGKSKSFWWGYEEECGKLGESVIIKARLAILTKEELQLLVTNPNHTIVRNNTIPQEVLNKTWPDFIWLQNENNTNFNNETNDTSWSTEKIFKNDILYVKKEGSTKEIELLQKRLSEFSYHLNNLINWFDAENKPNPLEVEGLIPTYKLRKNHLDKAIKFAIENRIIR